MDFKWNKIRIEGDNNIVVQDADGSTTQLALDQFIQQFTGEKDKRIAILEKSLFDKEKIEKLSDSEIQRLSQELKELATQKADQEKLVNQLLVEFSGKDLSQAGDLYQKALGLFLEGQLDSALAELEDKKLGEKLRKIELAEQAAKEERENLADTYVLKARMLQLKFDFKAAEEQYEKAIQVAPGWNTYHSAANYFMFVKQYPKANGYYLEAIRLAATPDKKADSLNNLAILQKENCDYDPAEKNYREALELYQELAKSYPKTYLQEVAGSLNNLAVLQNRLNQLGAAKENFQAALDIYRTFGDADIQQNKADLAMTLNNLAVLQQDKKEYESGKDNFREALAIRRELASSNPRQYLPDVGVTLNNLGILLKNGKEPEAAEKNYLEALDIRRQLAAINPSTYLPDLVTSLSNLGVLQKNMGKYDAAKTNLLEAEDISRNLVKSSPQAFLPKLAGVLNNLAILQAKVKDYPSAEKNYLETLGIYRNLIKSSPQAFLPDLAESEVNLSSFYQFSVPDKEKSLSLARDAFAHAAPFASSLARAEMVCQISAAVVKEWGEDPESLQHAGQMAIK